MPELFIGLMSGTSLDGIDASLVEFNSTQINPISFEYLPFSSSIKNDIQRLSQPNKPILLTEYGSTDTKLGNLFALAANNLLNKAGVPHSEVTAIGSHGQTIYHAPDRPPAFSLQIGDPNIIAEKTGITTVADFRRRDLAVSGQGAPLVPAFHQAIFSQIFDLTKENISIINIGGIANITYLSANKTTGFDIGPGNTLMDYWISKNLNKSYDSNGAWAKTGTPNSKLVDFFKQDPYFKLTPPKSTGKEYFSQFWFNKKISNFSDCCKKDIQASLCQFTAEAIAEAIQQHAPLTNQTLICGGGAHNEYLMQSIRKHLSHPVSSTAKFGVNPDHVEAMAFAWLAKQTINNLPGNIMEVTGAKAPAILGGIYPGRK
ncbi:MAG: anhydro-N-acetylmuramic acid kinase [Methylococcales bacterium]|nr:anhydro-N-acetylmuramic acid kinase [Methylococcales bacterium]